MKKYIYALLLASSVMACEKAKDLLTFEFEQSADFTVPAFPLVIDTAFSITLNGVPTNSDKVFSDNGTSADMVKDIKLKAMSLDVLSPSSQSLAFLKSVSFYISANGLSEILLASKDNIPDNTGQHLDLDASGKPLDAYIRQQTINLRIEIAADDKLPQDTEIKTVMTYSVTADPL